MRKRTFLPVPNDPRPLGGPPLVSAREVARCYGVTVETVRKWAREGKITFSRTPGGRYRYPASLLTDGRRGK